MARYGPPKLAAVGRRYKERICAKGAGRTGHVAHSTAPVERNGGQIILNKAAVECVYGGGSDEDRPVSGINHSGATLFHDTVAARARSQSA